MNPITASWNAGSLLGVVRQSHQQTSLKKTIHAYKSLSTGLKAKLGQLTQKREDLDSRAFVIVNKVEGHATPMPHPPTNTPETQPMAPTRMATNDYHHGDLSSLASTVTNILIESAELKLSYVTQSIQCLTTLYQENPKQRAPVHLMISRYEEWVETNQRLFELNSRLYDLEKVKFDLQRRENLEQEVTQRENREELGYTGSQLVQSNAMRIQSFLSRHQFPSHTPSTTWTYLQEVLTQRSDRVTLEAQKVQEYVNECVQNSRVDLDNITGAHPQSYQQFMAVLCNFMVERQREVQGVHLPHSMVYSTVERVVVPQIQSILLRYVQQREKDAKIREQCERFSGITLQQLNVKAAYQSPELVPFIEAIAQLRATYFTPTPTDKMSGVVAAAKAVYDQLSTMGENSIDGDSFLDLWMYVTIKANVPDLATSIEFMSLYGNPALGMDEAGYYLTTLSVAANFIETKLAEQELNQPNLPEHFVVCERGKFLHLSSMAGSCFRVVSEREEMRGYKVAVIKRWVLNKARLFCSVLVHTGNPEDIAVVSVIRLTSADSTAATVEYFTKKLTKPQLGWEGLRTQTTPLGDAVSLDLQDANKSLYFLLDEGDFDKHRPQIEHVTELIGLGSKSIEQSCEVEGCPKSEDSDFIYVFTPPQEDSEESFSHRTLSEIGNSRGGPDLLNSDLSTPAKSHSKSATNLPGHHGDEVLDSGPSSFISHSPYLFSYSPRRVAMEEYPPAAPLDTGEKPGHAKWGFSKLRTSLRKAESRESLDSQQPPQELPTLNITEPNVGFHTPNKLGHTPNPLSLKKKSGYQELEDSYLLSTTSDFTPENADPNPHDRFTKSDNFGSPLDDNDESPASLRRLRNSLRARLSFSKKQKNSKQSSPAPHSTFLGVPALHPRGEGPGNASSSKLRSKSSTAEERYVKSRERGRGSFVLVKIKEPGPEDFLGGGYMRKLEENFRINHLFGSLTVDVEEGMRGIIRRGQMYLQHLNFLSVAVSGDGMFSEVMLTAVRRFQESHNRHDSSFSSSLLVDGHLNSVTFQYLRQAFLTLYASMFRLGILSELMEGFDPTSTQEEDVRAFRGCVGHFQESYGLQCSHRGLLCHHTIAVIGKMLTQHHHSNRINRAL